jgi:poly(A) polymerase
LEVDGVSIDLLFAQLQLPSVPTEMASIEDSHLSGVDERCARSVNGCRVAARILEVVPDVETYRTTLRLVKHWSRRKGIYSNIHGFFGGITWALLVARVCQLYPNYAPSQLVNRFFRVYEKWNWKNAVLLCNTEDLTNLPGFEEFKVWNPKVNPRDKLDLMPILTPTFPAMNTTYNCSEMNKRIILNEMNRAYQVVVKVLTGVGDWAEVSAGFCTV